MKLYAPNLSNAQKQVRKIIKNGLSEPLTVYIKAGNYLESNLLFNKEDSGTEEFPITYKAEGKVVLNGAFRIPNDAFHRLGKDSDGRILKEHRDKILCADLKGLGLTQKDWGPMTVFGTFSIGSAKLYDDVPVNPSLCQLYINDNIVKYTRYPAEGWLTFDEPLFIGGSAVGLTEDNFPDFSNTRNPASDIFGMDEDTAQYVKAWSNAKDIWLYGYPKWGYVDHSTPVTKLDSESGAIHTGIVTRYSAAKDRPYCLFNILEELNTPNTWYLDRDNGLLYLYPDSDIKDSEITITINDTPIMTLEECEHIKFEGITFSQTRNSGVLAKGDYIAFDRCVFKNINGTALEIQGENCTVRNCDISYIGGRGIVMSGGDRDTLTPSGNLIENNSIHHYASMSRTYNPAIRLDGVGAICRKNKVHDSPHQAITYNGNDHIIEYNEIYNVCYFADDSAAIYSGRSYTCQGNIIRRNFIHDLESSFTNSLGIFAVYCDDNLAGVKVEENIFLRCQTAMLYHGGHDLTFKNNVIIDACPKSQYSMRFHSYGLWKTLIEGGHHMKGLDMVPWQSDIWKKRFPNIEKYLAWDVKTEQIFPHFNDISNNLIVNHKPIDINFDYADNRFENNIENNNIFENMDKDTLENYCEKILPLTYKEFKRRLDECSV